MTITVQRTDSVDAEPVIIVSAESLYGAVLGLIEYMIPEDVQRLKRDGIRSVQLARNGIHPSGTPGETVTNKVISEK